jgi:hypothetical protein
MELPVLPVIPWVITRVFLSIRMDISISLNGLGEWA